MISRKATALLLPCEELEIASGLSAVDPWHRVRQQTRTLLYVPDVHLAIEMEHAPVATICSGVGPPAKEAAIVRAASFGCWCLHGSPGFTGPPGAADNRMSR